MLTIWGNKHCKRCTKLKESLKKHHVPFTEGELNEDAMYALKDKDLRNELYGMLQWQERELPVITLDKKAITWEEFTRNCGGITV